ncbi:MAG: allantoicase [Deltaproteobacteria bacterium]|nr:MAG: allantoicase [Deltaproteobacteria bacterium]
MTTSDFDFTDAVDLANERLGGRAVDCNDEFFAPMANLVRAAAPVFDPDRYTDRGKWMDGWETRRRRQPGHDWCVVRLGLPGVVEGIVVDTAHFTGNYPEACSIDVRDADAGGDWVEAVPRSPLCGDARNRFVVGAAGRVTHVRLNIYPDGGVARLRVHGRVVPDWQRAPAECDLASIAFGGVVEACSDMHFGSRHNLILPGDATHMGDGWETRRRRGPGHDWAIVRLGAPGHLVRAVVDTQHFKGNAPAACSLEVEDAGGSWHEVLPRTPLSPDRLHELPLAPGPVAVRARLNIYPDGGVARLRLYGRRAT